MANDIEKLSNVDPKRIVRRAKNKAIGEKLVIISSDKPLTICFDAGFPV